MPAEDRRGAAVGAPGFGQFACPFLARARAQLQDAADGFLHRKVAGGPDVGAAFGEEKIDFGRPAADALDAREQGDGLLIVGGERVEGQFAVEDQLREAFGIALFLPRQTAGAQRVEVGGGDRLGRTVFAELRLEFVPDRGRGGDADLLADDGAEQSRIARRADARFGVARIAERAREIGVALGQRVDSRVQLLLAEAHRIFSFCSFGSQ